MTPLSRKRKQEAIVAIWLMLTILACGSLERLQQLNPQGRAPATGAAIASEGNQFVITEAFEKIHTLPGYHLKRQRRVVDNLGNRTGQIIVSEYDGGGNIHTINQDSEGRQSEVYYVDGQTYVFEAQYEGWVRLGPVSPGEAQHADEISLQSLEPVGDLVQLFTQFGAIPTEVGHEMLLNRAVTRYKLEDVIVEMSEALGQEPIDAPIDLRGMLWVDDRTGALIKLEMSLFNKENKQLMQELLLEISEIGEIAPIAPPSPIIDPAAIASATATAQARTVLEVEVAYHGEPITFEIVPVQVIPVADSSPLRAEMQLILRQLPANLFQESNLEPFLAQLRHQLTLSIPRRNLVITSSGYHLKDSDPQNRTVEVIYLFNADLEDFSHVELILSRQGNPLFAPVPVEGEDR